MILVLIFNDFNGSLLTKLNLIRSSYSFKRFLFHFRCPFGLGFDEANLICNWPWLVPGCGGTVAAGAGVGAGAIGGAPRGGKFLRPDANRGINRQPAGRQEKAFGRGNSGDRPSFAENNAGFQSGIDPLNSFKSANPARQSTITARPATATLRPITPAFVTTPDPNAGFAFGDIAVDGCDNCESPGLRVVGNGVRNGKGLEVANAGSGFPTSTFSPSTTVGEGGYSYPVPANPLELPVRQPGISVSNPGEIGLLPDGGLSTTYAPSPAPSTTYAPSPIPSSTYAPAPIPSSTYAPSPIPSSTYAPSPMLRPALLDMNTLFQSTHFNIQLRLFNLLFSLPQHDHLSNQQLLLLPSHQQREPPSFLPLMELLKMLAMLTLHLPTLLSIPIILKR